MIAPIYKTITALREKLADESAAGGYWVGELSSSALATATAVYALATVNTKLYEPLIHRGLDWLRDNINSDGGWGDTVNSKSNISTTALCWAALATDDTDQYSWIVERAENWLRKQAGGLTAAKLVRAIGRRYGRDRSFATPILAMCALSRRLGAGEQAWRWIRPLPFELALLPHRWWKRLQLRVVSYALPALIAVGQLIYYKRQPKNFLVRIIRGAARMKTLEILENIQPESGGFLEATPLTSFVVMSLAGAGIKDHAVVRKGTEFITSSVRQDGSWPIDTNLATWVTTLAINAQAVDPEFTHLIQEAERRRLAEWLIRRQTTAEHPYTHAAPGGWSWTYLSGGVPDADDTAGALLALRNLSVHSDQITVSAKQGIKWLLELQNRDGGIPTFCKGWGKLPFDRSGADLTAHAVRAWAAWYDELSSREQSRIKKAITRAIKYLSRTQKPDGSWVALWFGNQHTFREENPVYGTARVLSALLEVTERFAPTAKNMLVKGARWLVTAQHEDGGWGAKSNSFARAPGSGGSIEETSLALEALAKAAENLQNFDDKDKWRQYTESAITRGTNWLIERTDEGKIIEPAPIGLYFAHLWYTEKLYPLIFTLAALEQVKKIISTTN